MQISKLLHSLQTLFWLLCNKLLWKLPISQNMKPSPSNFENLVSKHTHEILWHKLQRRTWQGSDMVRCDVLYMLTGSYPLYFKETQLLQMSGERTSSSLNSPLLQLRPKLPWLLSFTTFPLQSSSPPPRTFTKGRDYSLALHSRRFTELNKSAQKTHSSQTC